MNEKAEMKNTSWDFSAKATAPYDPLLGCLLIFSKLMNHPTSPQSLVAGMPLVENRLTPDLFILAAARAGFSAKIRKKNLLEIEEQHLPAVLFLQNMQACLLTSIDRENNQAEIIDPESGGTSVVKLQELEKKYAGFAVYIKPAYKFDTEFVEPQKKHYRNWFWRVIRKGWPIYSEILVASFLINLFTIASPLFVMNVYDRVVPNAAIATLWVLAIGVTVVFAFDFLLRTLRAYFIDAVGRKIDVQLSNATFEQVLGLEMGARPSSTGTLANVIHAFESFREFITSASVSLIVDIPFTILFLAVIGLLGGYVVVVPIVIIPLVLLVNFLIHFPLSKLVHQNYLHAAEKHAILFESLTGAETIKGMRAEGQMQRKWDDVINAMAKLSVKLRAFGTMGTNFSIYAQHMAVVGVVIAGVYRIGAGNMTIGGLIACVILTGRTLAPVSQMASLLTRYKQSKTSLRSLDQVMKMPVERSEQRNFLHKPQLKGCIEFKDVEFFYPNQIVPALDKITFRINPGERVGIIGKSGSGKTTIEKLMLKLYNPTAGTVLIDGVDLRQLDPAEVRHNIGYVPQDVMLFTGTIRDNIVIGAPYVDDRAVLRAAQLSGVDTFINKHPEGFERQIFERGQNLSGGQRQAVAMARASVLDPPIFLFDEPFNSIDDATIAHFFERLAKQISRKTLILVTHRASLLKLIDRLLVIDSGKLVLDGPKEEVIERLRGKSAATETETKAKTNTRKRKTKKDE